MFCTEGSGKYAGVKETPCPLSNNQVNADEDHFLLICFELQDLRAKYRNKCYQQNSSLDHLMDHLMTSTARLSRISMICK